MAAANFEAVGAAALQMAQVLLPDWLGGHREGHEWLGERRANGGVGDSWKVNLKTGVWANFSGEDRGSDLVSLYAALNHLNQGAALKQVASLVGVTDAPVHVLRNAPVEPAESPVQPIPDEAPPIQPHPRWGAPVATYRYGDAFWVVRFERDGEKHFNPYTWRGGKWHMRAHPAPRRLYRLEDLAKHPQAPVMIVEGEKCVD